LNIRTKFACINFLNSLTEHVRVRKDLQKELDYLRVFKLEADDSLKLFVEDLIGQILWKP